MDHYTTNQDTDNNQFIISYELVALLRWLIEHDVDKFKKMVNKAYSAGLKEDIRRIKNKQEEVTIEDIHFTILEFLSMMDTLISETIQEKVTQSALEKNLMPAIEHIDSTICDNAIVRSSIEKAAASDLENPRTVLYKELLKRWKPNKKMVIN
ncbi:MAG: hypothetical protein M1114_06515 [Candidatus Dependentiae bacterium]|nr:hypothetical protein [Candidatus Dependentiae bacterium]